MPQFPGSDLGLFHITQADMPEAVRMLERAIHERGHRFFCFCEASLLSSAIRDPAARRVLQQADAVFPDGVALMVLARIRGVRLPARVPGPSFILAACDYGVGKGWRHFFYGGAPGVADALADELTRRYPGIRITGIYSPPFRPLTGPEEAQVKTMVEASGANVLWVALGSPKQELWCAEHLGKIDVPVLLPVGAAFDFHTRQQPWAPAWIRKIGMEWLFRTLTGGRRTFGRNMRCLSIVAVYIAGALVRRCVGASMRKKRI